MLLIIKNNKIKKKKFNVIYNHEYPDKYDFLMNVYIKIIFTIINLVLNALNYF